MDIKTIAARVNQDFLRSNRFTVQIAGAPQIVNDLCCAVSHPGITYSHKLWRNAGPAIRIPIEPTFDMCKFTFYCDAQGVVPEWVRKWNRDVCTPEWDLNYFSDYVRDIDVWEWNVQGEQVAHVKIINGYPITVDAVELAFSTTNTVQTISMQVTYEYYELG